jgi:hypothetical protein
MRLWRLEITGKSAFDPQEEHPPSAQAAIAG